MPLNKQLQNSKDETYLQELEDTKVWNRAKVKECIVSVVMTAQRLSHDSLEMKELLASWPDCSSVRYEWFRYISTLPEVKIKLNQAPSNQSAKNVYRVLVQWLDLVDSFKDRVIIIIHSCGLSYKKIIKIFPERRWTETSLSAHYNNVIDKLVYDLNHVEGLEYSAGTNFDDYE